MLGQLTDLEANVVDGAFNLWHPVLERAGGTLQRPHPRILRDLQI
jgi:hypothetical protein